MADFGYNRINYGIHSIVPFSIQNGRPFGALKVLGSAALNMSSEFEEMFGGSNKNAWAVEAKTITTEWTASVKSLPNFLFELFLGASIVETAASATGTVSQFKNILNASVLNAATGIATITAKVGAEQDLKDGVYIAYAVSATTVDIYGLSDIEFKKLEATNTLSFLDSDLKINDTPLTIVTATATEIVGLGVEMTGGSGTIGMTVGDTARVDVRSAHAGLSEIHIGSDSTTFKEHRQVCLAGKRANGDTMEIELYKVVGSGFGLNFEEQAFSIQELNMKLVYDSCEDKVATIRAKRGESSVC